MPRLRGEIPSSNVVSKGYTTYQAGEATGRPEHSTVLARHVRILVCVVGRLAPRPRHRTEGAAGEEGEVEGGDRMEDSAQ